MKLLKQIKAIWDWVFPWRYLRNARRECKHCGTRQDTYSNGWGAHDASWWETMSPVRACSRIDHGPVYPTPDDGSLAPLSKGERQQLLQDDMDRELAGAHYKTMGYP